MSSPVEKSYGYPEGVHPDTGPYTHAHIQTAPPGRERLGMFLAPTSMTLAGRKGTTDMQMVSAVLWDIADVIDPICITDGLDWYFGLSD